MDEIKKLLENMQREIKQQKTDMLEMKEDIKISINNNINEKFKNLQLKNELLEKKIEEQTIAINNFERHIRRKNLVIFGVEEQEKSYHELEKRIIDILNTNFNLKYDNNNIEAVRRLGRKSDKVRPVVITLSTLGLKIYIQKNKKRLEKTPYYIKQDYPIEILKKRKELQTQLKKEKELGKKALIKYDKLIVLNDKEKKKSHNNASKRNLSESRELSEPKLPCNPGNNTQKQAKYNQYDTE
ncbi:unnamed protein product [Parnassius mnemosyne]|uniref:Endonuclease-reverse transcriptase n=1 Tax=Parnassius mnemosyne TaxID=213953 RepID=A0AAV1LKV9_9NEOP